nr:hypothetical protein GCM10020092_003790 [Actinoplanes digitatis]
MALLPPAGGAERTGRISGGEGAIGPPGTEGGAVVHAPNRMVMQPGAQHCEPDASPGGNPGTGVRGLSVGIPTAGRCVRR